jgi:hypothetical protein
MNTSRESFARALQLGDRLLLAGDRHELGLEALVDVDAELLLGRSMMCPTVARTR